MKELTSWFKVDPEDTALARLLTLNAFTSWEDRHFPKRAINSPQVLVLDETNHGLDSSLVTLASYLLNGFYVNFVSSKPYPHASLHEHTGSRAGRSALVVVLPNLSIPNPLDPLTVLGLAITDINCHLEQVGIEPCFPPLPPIEEIPRLTLP